jgi:hypothetical protein
VVCKILQRAFAETIQDLMQLFTRKWCGKQLQWWIVQDLCDTGKAPDIIFEDDPSFSPLTTAEQCDTQQLVQLLSNWTGDTATLIGLLLSLYVQHNKARIAAAVTDERILFELTMLDELGCQEVLLTGDQNTRCGITHHQHVMFYQQDAGV